MCIRDSFDGLPEGSELELNGRTFVITYEGGDGNDVVLTDSTVRVVDGELRILGTNERDTIKVSESRGNYVVSGKRDGDSFSVTVDGSNVDRLWIDALGLHDNVDTRSIDLPTTVIGGDGNDTLRTGSGDDSIVGGDGDDYLSAAKGDDVIRGGGGNDRMFGSDGHDEIAATGGNNTVSGGTGDDTVTTGAGADSIVTNGGDDSVVAGAGDDTVKTAGGDDTVLAGNGDDFVSSGSQADSVEGGSGHDELRTGNGKDTVVAGVGNDTVVAGRGDDTVFGSAGNDSVAGNNGDDLLVGGTGDDTLGGNRDRDALFGGAGVDVLNAGSHDDLLVAAGTTYDADAVALDAIMQEWISVRSYATRIANLRDGSGSNNGKNETYYLAANSTVNDDNDFDSLTGGTSSDWYFAKRMGSLFDSINGLESDELVDELI